MVNDSKICFSCLQKKTLSEEHVIPQALGGKLSEWIYCIDCNSTFGADIDAELIKSVQFYATTLGIKRTRGKNQPYDVSLDEGGAKLTFDGKEFKRKKPSVTILKTGEKVSYVDVKARSESELKRIIYNIKKRHNISDDIECFEDKHPCPTDTITEFKFDNDKIRRCISKIAYSLLCIRLPSAQVQSNAFDEVRNYIRFGSGDNLSSANYVHTVFMTDGIRPLHKIHISLNRRNNLVVGFVCLFGTFIYTTLLSREFRSSLYWPGIDHTLDPVTSKVIEGNPSFRAPSLTISDVISPKNKKQQVLNGLAKGLEILSKYHGDHEFLKIETE